MTISFSELGSGLDTSSWVEALVSIKQAKVTSLQNNLTSVQGKKSTLSSTRSSISSLRSAIETLTDKKFGGIYNLFGRNNAVSSNEDVFTATATSSAVRQNYNISVEKLATMTKATSRQSASSVADNTTKLSSLGITEGSFAVFVDGIKHNISVDNDSTFDTLRTGLADIGIDATIDANGVLKLESQDPLKSVHIGTTTDTSNFISFRQ